MTSELGETRPGQPRLTAALRAVLEASDPSYGLVIGLVGSTSAGKSTFLAHVREQTSQTASQSREQPVHISGVGGLGTFLSELLAWLKWDRTDASQPGHAPALAGWPMTGPALSRRARGRRELGATARVPVDERSRPTILAIDQSGSMSSGEGEIDRCIAGRVAKVGHLERKQGYAIGNVVTARRDKTSQPGRGDHPHGELSSEHSSAHTGAGTARHLLRAPFVDSAATSDRRGYGPGSGRWRRSGAVAGRSGKPAACEMARGRAWTQRERPPTGRPLATWLPSRLVVSA